MRIGISTACFYPGVNTEDTLEIISNLGFDLCEAFLESEYEMTEEYCYKLRDKAESLGISFHSVHAFNSIFEPFLFDRYQRRREDMEKRFFAMCKAGAILGAEYYTFHGITSVMHNGDLPEIAQKIGRLCSLAKERGIKLSQENVSWCRSSEPSYVRQIKEANPEDLYFTFDIKQAVRSGKLPQLYLELYKDKLSTVHINDASESSMCLLPGKGSMPMESIAKLSAACNPDAPFIIEVYRESFQEYEELAQAKAYMERLNLTV